MPTENLGSVTEPDGNAHAYLGLSSQLVTEQNPDSQSKTCTCTYTPGGMRVAQATTSGYYTYNLAHRKVLGVCMEPQEIRSTVLDLLSRLYVPVAADDLSLCAEVTAGLRVPEETVADLARRDFEDFSGGPERDIWICPALDYPGGSANCNYLTRSDWSARSRLVEGVLSEAQELMLLRNLCDMAAIAVEQGDPSQALRRLMDRIDDLAIHIPELAVEEMRSRRTVPTSDVLLYREIAEDLYGPLIRIARKRQREVVDTIDRLPLPERYFGR
jgi:hypothetical protein